MSRIWIDGLTNSQQGDDEPRETSYLFKRSHGSPFTGSSCSGRAMAYASGYRPSVYVGVGALHLDDNSEP